MVYNEIAAYKHGFIFFGFHFIINKKKNDFFLKLQIIVSAIIGFLDCGNTPDSGPNSPPSTISGSRGSPTSAPIQEENEDPNYQGGRGSINDLSLYTSPSMPNISLGRPHLSNAHTAAHSYVSFVLILFL